MRLERLEDRRLLAGWDSGGTVEDGVLVGTAGDDDLRLHHKKLSGVNTVEAGYGDDRVRGHNQNDDLSGGPGNDVVIGGGGNDVIRLRSDAGEPAVGQAGGDIAQGDTLYEGQPVANSDRAVGGDGADQFIVTALISCKPEICAKHVDEAGTIDWQGVAGENNATHDHWVEAFGDEVFADFNPAEGDSILVEGHTVSLLDVQNVDNGDGTADTIFVIESDQGAGGGAHTQDLLGTIRVPGTLTADDITVDNNNTNKFAGLVENIADLRPDAGFAPDEADLTAIASAVALSEADEGEARPDVPPGLAKEFPGKGKALGRGRNQLPE